MTAPNIQYSTNAAVLDGGAFGAVIYGDKTPAQVNGDLTISGNVLIGGSLAVTGAGDALPTYVKASLPIATSLGSLIYVSNATGAHVTGSVAFSNALDATHWIDLTTGVAVV